MKIAVVTAYWDADAPFIEQCHESVLGQTYNCHHIIVCDGCAPPRLSRDGEARRSLIRLAAASGDYGNTPRSLGGERALALGFDAIAYLDADNWFHPQHIESTIARAVAVDADVCVSERMIVTMQGAPIGVCLNSNGKYFADTSTMTLFGRAKDQVGSWRSYGKRLASIGDRLFFRSLVDMKYAVTCTDRATVAYRAKHAAFYRRANLPIPHVAREKTGTKESVKDYCGFTGIDLSVDWRIMLWNDLEDSRRLDWLQQESL